jgi:tripartite ATP-independent transporter DctM subunit
MSSLAVGGLGIVALLALLAVRMPVGIAMSAVGFAGLAILGGWDAALVRLASTPFEHSYNYQLSVLPLFVLMGQCAAVSGMSRDAYAAAHAWVGHWRGGLASATIVACSGFAAVSGSSVASAATMGAVSLPEMRKYRYDPRLATGCVAAGGTLGILIPPSTGFIVYALLTEQSVGRLFMAGVVPGLLLTLLFMATVFVQTRLAPHLGPAMPRVRPVERVRALGRATSLATVVALVIGGIYLGVFTPTEAAAIGALLTMAVAFLRGRMSLSAFADTLVQTARTTSFIFLILIGAFFFGPFLAVSGVPELLSSALDRLAASPTLILMSILALYIVLGMFLEGFAMMVLTLPIVFPLAVKLGYDPIWFGVVMVIVLEMGLISPPVGINVYVVKGIAQDVPMRDIFAGIVPFWAAMIVCLALVVAFPGLALYLPDAMFGRG